MRGQFPEETLVTMPGTLSIETQTGVVFRNPNPHIRSRHAYFPSIASLGGDELLASYTVGEAFEAIDLRIHLSRSLDGGRTWQEEGALDVPVLPEGISESVKMSAVGESPSGNQLAGLLQRHDRREFPGEGLTNPETLGFVPTRFEITRSEDGGRSWSEPSKVEPPLEGPEWELCAPLTVLPDGRWLLVTSTWPDWQGRLPHGHRLVAFVSHDQGEHWSEFQQIMHEEGGPVVFWESKVLPLPDGRLLAVAWTHDLSAGTDRPNHYSISSDGGESWSPPASTGLIGQTQTPCVLDQDRILVVYRRTDEPGLWLQDVRFDGATWVNGACVPLWGHDVGGKTKMSDSMVQNFRVLRFGAPSVVLLPDKTLYIAFWCYEDSVSVIRWFRVAI